MAGRLLSFKEYIGGADNVQVIEMFPKDQKSFTYDFDADVSAYDFTADYQSIVLSTVTYDRVSGDPNFADTTVSGYFTNTANVDPATYINEDDAATGTVILTIPADRYTGNVAPDARTDVIATVFSFQWETNDTPPQKQRHRWLILERFDPTVGKVPLANVELEPGFVSLTS